MGNLGLAIGETGMGLATVLRVEWTRIQGEGKKKRFLNV
jgi:hypothetical protein